MNNILVVGGAGYLGTAIIKKLLSKKYVVTVLDNYMYRDCNITKFPEKFDSIKQIKKDAKNINSDDFENIDCCIFLSALSNNPIDNIKPKKAYDETRDYTIKAAKICKSKNIKFIFPSSCSVYGKNDSQYVDEKSDVNPLTFYSLNKREIEIELLKISDESFKPIMLRIATILGFSEMLRFDLYINMFVGMMLTSNKIVLNSDGSAWRPNVFIDDVADVFEGLIKVNINEPLILNVGNNENTKRIIDIANILCKLYPGLKIETLKTNNTFSNIKDDIIKNNKDQRSYKVSFDKIKNEYPSLYPKTDIKSAIIKLVKDVEEINLTLEKFNSNKFYRLQRLQYLTKNKSYPNS